MDGTLVIDGAVNTLVMEFAQERIEAGWDLLLWSMRGRKHAKHAASLAGLDDVAICTSKPGCVVDDRGLDWLKEVDLVRLDHG